MVHTLKSVKKVDQPDHSEVHTQCLNLLIWTIILYISYREVQESGAVARKSCDATVISMWQSAHELKHLGSTFFLLTMRVYHYSFFVRFQKMLVLCNIMLIFLHLCIVDV